MHNKECAAESPLLEFWLTGQFVSSSHPEVSEMSNFSFLLLQTGIVREIRSRSISLTIVIQS